MSEQIWTACTSWTWRHNPATRRYPLGRDRHRGRSRYRARAGADLNPEAHRLIVIWNTVTDRDPDSDPDIEDSSRLATKFWEIHGWPERPGLSGSHGPRRRVYLTLDAKGRSRDRKGIHVILRQAEKYLLLKMASQYLQAYREPS
jgi:hypothetical protein